MAADDNCRSIILFGRTGSGKSTTGNMLWSGHPGPLDGGFSVGDGFRGVTSSFTVKDGRYWLVTDTVGLGETEQGTVSSQKAEDNLFQFLRKLKHSYHHIVYVVKKGRMQDSDAVTWELFKKIFEGGEANFVVVFTCSTQKWVNDNMKAIREEFVGCESFVAVDFPPISEDSEQETFNERVRANSLQHFEGTLRGYEVKPVYPIVSHMNPIELLQHAKVIIQKLVRFAVQRFAARFVTNAENPLAWLMKTLGGFL